jgi:hypothetical protein
VVVPVLAVLGGDIAIAAIRLRMLMLVAGELPPIERTMMPLASRRPKFRMHMVRATPHRRMDKHCKRGNHRNNCAQARTPDFKLIIHSPPVRVKANVLPAPSTYLLSMVHLRKITLRKLRRENGRKMADTSRMHEDKFLIIAVARLA